MSSFHGEDKKRSFFEGWYFKHQSEQCMLALIPGMNITRDGEKSAFIQIITDEGTANVPYPYTEFAASPNWLEVRVGNSYFSERGVKIDIRSKDIRLRGQARYGIPTYLKYDIMGPFARLPFMECNHGIVSLYHIFRGEFELNGKKLMLDDGIGYIEKDWGRSFPQNYLWMQCNHFGKRRISIVASIAEIPVPGFRFRGCICVVYIEGREYRMATYNGVRILRYDENGLELKHGRLRLKIEMMEKIPHPLFAPTAGEMQRVIHENAACRARFYFSVNGEVLLDTESRFASFEYAWQSPKKP